MTNDLSTLSGALLEMKDQLIYELGQKGVTAQYDSTTGLLGLIGEISNIQTGGSCYKVTFDNASYTTSGTATVSVTVQKNYSLCVGETVTFTSSTSTTTTATTNSSGVATATINFSGSTTLTASIGGVSDTATITVSQYLIYDDCSSSTGLSNYGSSIRLTDGQTSSCSLSYDSNNNCYALTGSGNYISAVTLTPLDNMDDVKVRIKFKLGGTSNYYQCILAVAPSKTNNTAFDGIRQMNGNFQNFYASGGSSGSESTKGSVSNVSSQWHYLELIKDGTSLTGTVYDSTLTQIATFTKTIDTSYKYYLLGMNTERGYTTYISEIIAESI